MPVQQSSQISKLISIALVLLLILVVTLKAIAQDGNTYYVDSSAGNDANPGTADKPWKSLAKVNTFKFIPGDNILFKRGQTFNGPLEINISGSRTKYITYGAYGNGKNPIITGFTQLFGWSKVAERIWATNVKGLLSNVSMVTFNGKIAPIGRYPNPDAKNGGYITFTSHEGNNTIIAPITVGTNWTGAELVVRRTNWILDRGTITSQNAGKISYNSQSKEDLHDGFGFFIQNDLRTLDETGEWYFNSDKKRLLMYCGKAPSNTAVQISLIDNVVNVNADFIVIKDLSIQGANKSGIIINQRNRVQILHNEILYSGQNAITANGNALFIKGNTINGTNDIAIKSDRAPNSEITDNNIFSTGLIAGMGTRYIGVEVYGDNLALSNNTITNSGYDGIKLDGNNATIKNNVIKGFTSVIDDGGGIYLPGKLFKNRNVLYNIISDGIGAPDGTTKVGNSPSEGIYADDSTSYINIIGNTVSNVAGHGIKIHNAHDIVIKGNTLYNNKTQLILDHDKNPNGGLVRNITVTKNTFVPGPATQNTLTLASPTDDVKDYGNIDSNYYVNTTGSSPITVKTSLGQLRDAQLATSITSTIFDKNSKKFALLSPSVNNLKTAPANNVLIKTNKTSKPQTISLGNGTFVDLNGKQYIKSVNLAPFTSLILLKK